MAKNTKEMAPFNPNMEVKAKIYSLNLEGNPRANLSLSLNDAFVVNGVKLMEKADGDLYAAMPSYKQSTGKYQDVCYPLAAELREEINRVANSAYQQAIGQLQGQNAAPFPEQALAGQELQA